ncbi:hypothetical protein PAXRUDRAFT_827517 [Paxillus rubicundulus Ve08.2h10]|uniref:Uncharacterized protein n=1 Tax=Paxillus rubicundulus Ve08.2h10 TaxID=930991 RepID=A0A0D0DXS7_9AGAM|nr:hypothetical protein PAXRUDRAFT_827517 [Paxillus rubicundulus Ve08.2h10]
MQFPGAWPESPSSPNECTPSLSLLPEPSSAVKPLEPRRQLGDSLSSTMAHTVDHQVLLASSNSLEEPSTYRTPSSPARSATQSIRKVPPLRIIVPPTEYCPFSTDLTLPITPLSLAVPLSSSCCTFSDTQEPPSQSVSVPSTPALVLSSACSDDTAVANFASPTSSQFLLMPPTPHSMGVGNDAAISASPLGTPTVANGPKVLIGPKGTKSGDLRPWELSCSTWLTDLGGHTETDRIFRQNLPDTTSVHTDSSLGSTPELSLSPLSPPSQFPSTLACHFPVSLARSPVSSPILPSLHTMPPQLYCSSPTRLALKPTGTDTFPSTMDSLQAWREGVSPGVLQVEEPCSVFVEDAQSPAPPGAQSAEPVPEAVVQPSFSTPRQSRPPAPRISKSRNLMRRAKKFGGRVKQFVVRHSASQYHSGMDSGVNFRIVTSQDSENGSVILISAPPPPYDARPLTPIPTHSPEEDNLRSRTVSQYSSALPGSTLERSTTGATDSSYRQEGSSRRALRRLSLAAFSSMKRI